MTLTQFHDGIPVPEHAARVPWLINESQLGEYLPVGSFDVSSGGWPQLRMTLLGVTATFAFNFVTHPESRFLGVAFHAAATEDIDAVFRTNSAAICARLGQPNAVNHPDGYHLMWRDACVWIDYSAGVPEHSGAERKHSLSIYFHSGRPRAWVPAGERTLAQVKRLLNLLPGVEVIEIVGPPTHKTLGLAVRSTTSLARLAHVAGWANVRFGVGVDEYRKANEGLKASDPAGLLYRLEIPGPREPGPGGYATTLQILGLYLAGDLREQGILAEDEACRLSAVFNNHKVENSDTDV